ncbi:hypothetical protein GNP59_18540 [Aliivibrio fischeri]|nr:hypothetical protein [Aliivibrio fischeri]
MESQLFARVIAALNSGGNLVDLNKVQLMLLIGFVGFIFYLVQNYLWLEAGKTKESKGYIFSHQIDIWTADIYRKFDELKESNVTSSLVLTELTIHVDSDYLIALKIYHNHLTKLMLSLRFLGQTGAYILEENCNLFIESKSLLKETNKILKDHKAYTELLSEQTRKQNEVERYLNEIEQEFGDLVSIFNRDDIILTDKQSALLIELYSSEDLFMKHGSDPFKFVRDFGNTTNIVLFRYEEILKAYNIKVSKQQGIKKTILLILTVTSVFFTFKLAGVQ